MSNIYGFTLLRDEHIKELNTQARIYRHLQTGAQLLSMSNDDENKVFGIAFRTPPADSTGIAHILEHCVLGGSRKFPLKEPFVQLLKGSLKTFLNAMTYPDKTVYPTASTNLQDFYNLVDVYLDAVFHPLITPNHLAQEGWHYELETLDSPLTYKGVVYNEMKGAYSSPDNLLYRYAKQSLFPDNTYRYDSGGDPTVIPALTYEQFKTFHSTYYHPSNARIFFYGDDDPEKRLQLLDGYLRDFQPIHVNGEVTLQQPFATPKQFTYPYNIDAANQGNQKAMVQLNWGLTENDDPALLMGLSLLSQTLLGMPASPLRKTLMDAGVGEDVTGGGLSTGLRQMTFAVGMKGVASANVTKIEPLILDTLTQLAQNGIDVEMVEASLNTIEFGLRENNTGSYPRGLSLMLRALSTWNYERDPLTGLAYEAPLGAVKEALANDSAYLQRLIRDHLLQNQHRTTIVLEPDADLNRRLEEAEKERLAAARAQMKQTDLQSIMEKAQELKRLQEAPDSPEALAAMPMLKLSDLEKQVKTIPIDVSEAHDCQLLFHDLFTNGIVYLNLGFDLHTVPQMLLPFVNLFGRALVEMGTEREDFVKLQQRIGRDTGGIWHSSLLSPMRRSDETCARFFLSGKATMDKAPELLAILRDVLLTTKLDDRERFQQIVLKTKVRTESALVPSGHSFVSGRLRATFNQADWAEEQMGGLEYLFFLRRLAQQIEQDWPSVAQQLEAVRHALVSRSNLLCNITLDGDNWARFQPQLADFLTQLPQKSAQQSLWTPNFGSTHEGLVAPAQVNYVGKGANIYDLGYRYHGSINVLTNFIRTSWLWEKIRMQGGAYGAFCSFGKQSGLFTFLSYRDPNLLNTLDVYDQTAAMLRSSNLDAMEMTRNIIGAIGAMDGYQLPDAKGFTSLVRYLLGESDADRQQVRDEVLSTTLRDFHNFADILDAVKTEGRVVVMGSQAALDEVNAKRNGWLKLQKVL